MLNFRRLAAFLASGILPERTALDESLEEHDRRFHGGCFEAGKMRCSKRDGAARVDGVDEVECTEEKIGEIRRAIDFLLNTEPVCSITGEEFGPDGRKLTEKIPEFFEREYGGVAHSPEFGDISLDIIGVQDDLGHGIGRTKAAAFAAVHDIIEKGVSYNKSLNWKGRGWQTAVVAAPIEIGGVPYVGEVVLKEIPARIGLYLHEVEVQKKAECGFLRQEGGRLGGGGSVSVSGSGEKDGGERSRLVLSRLAECCL